VESHKLFHFELLINIRRGWKCLAVVNTLAYSGAWLQGAKSFIIQAPDGARKMSHDPSRDDFSGHKTFIRRSIPLLKRRPSFIGGASVQVTIFSIFLFVRLDHRRERIDRLPIGMACLPCFGWVVMSSAAT